MYSDRYLYFRGMDSPSQTEWLWAGIFAVDVRTGRETRANVQHHSAGSPSMLLFGGSPDGTRVALLDRWETPGEPPPDYEGMSREEYYAASQRHALARKERARYTFTVASFDQSPAVEILTRAPAPKRHLVLGGPSNIDAPVQWSPDGRLLALNLGTVEEDLEMTAVRVFETRTWTEVACFTQGALHGTASWGPDSDRFLMQSWSAKTGRIAMWIQHLDGSRQQVEIIPPPNSVNIRPVWAVGMADNAHLLTMRAPRKRATLMRTSLATGTHENLMTWPGLLENPAVVAQLPPGAWT
ncbi:hypothetical protein [Demequina capsici]|uniref:WD40-like Beta Propeller Repeat n=1 Tax=Demequina capsici TaxID=3075620 RepID=A0AA96F7N6_9MICO|nr:hypothetical protein [Demequina sp. OYTSA14]WNM24784.1 hypothetical protein RN606_01125 [Demequina sp. OYTSA14]